MATTAMASSPSGEHRGTGDGEHRRVGDRTPVISPPDSPMMPSWTRILDMLD